MSQPSMMSEGSTNGYSPPSVDRIWGIWGCCSNISKAIFYLRKGDYKVLGAKVNVWGVQSFRA